MRNDSMTMDETIDAGTGTMHTTTANVIPGTGTSDDEQPPATNHSLKLSLTLYDDEDDVDMQTVKPADVSLKSLTPPISPSKR